ncbi:MAG: hypothetical protein WA240_13810 [Nitrospirota bacterium]
MAKTISLIIAASYVVAAYVLGKRNEMLLGTILFLILPLYLIWFGEGVGKWRFWGHVTTSETPDFMVKFAGWLLLLMPIIAILISSIV